MITITSNCNNCIHSKVCKHKGNAETDMTKLSNMPYGTGPNNDYDWNTMSNHRNVTITFSCPNYREGGGVFR